MITESIASRVPRVGRMLTALDRGLVGSYDVAQELYGMRLRGEITPDEMVTLVEENELVDAMDEVLGGIGEQPEDE